MLIPVKVMIAQQEDGSFRMTWLDNTISAADSFNLRQLSFAEEICNPPSPDEPAFIILPPVPQEKAKRLS